MSDNPHEKRDSFTSSTNKNVDLPKVDSPPRNAPSAPGVSSLNPPRDSTKDNPKHASDLSTRPVEQVEMGESLKRDPVRSDLLRGKEVDKSAVQLDQLNRIKDLFKDSGMDTMQQAKIYERLREILGF